MSSSASRRSVRIIRWLFRGIGRLLWALGKRGYALALIAIVLWLSWQALFYLISSLMLPARPAAKIVNIPTRLNQSAVLRPMGALKAQPGIANQRSPLSHYHRLDQGFELDQFNGCTASQCHAPLPHGKNKADRAFLNMHATSIHCSVCHAQTDQKPLPLVWYDLKTGTAGARNYVPALLRAYAWLTSPAKRNAPSFDANDQHELVDLVRAAVVEASSETELASLAEHLAAVRATSDDFVRYVKVTRQTIEGHFRGEYGAKLALADPRTSRPLLGQPHDLKAMRDFAAQREIMSDEQKKLMLDKIHPKMRQPTLHCAECHRSEGSLVDFRSLGYPAARIEAICSRQVTTAIDHIVEGKPFHLPNFLEGLK